MVKGELSNLLLAIALSNAFGRSRIIGSGIMTGVSALDACVLLRVTVLLLLLQMLLVKELLFLTIGLSLFSFLFKYQILPDLFLLLCLQTRSEMAIEKIERN
jgi:hypothetical protein